MLTKLDPTARTPGSHVGEDTGTITQVIVERGNAQNRNTDVMEDDPRYEVSTSRFYIYIIGFPILSIDGLQRFRIVGGKRG